jgi:hypothetical protein
MQVLDALTEIAFEPEMLVSRIDKEKKAVIAEAQMMNTIEYRVDCQLLQYLHWENALGYRFPIGKMEQVGREKGGSAAVFCSFFCLRRGSADLHPHTPPNKTLPRVPTAGGALQSASHPLLLGPLLLPSQRHPLPGG